MLTYNTQQRSLKLPEYGRTVQSMVDYCLTIEDRADRNRCAATIIDTMSQLLPSTTSADEHRRKLWDHLAIMADYRLDVDYPYEPVRADQLDGRPEPISYRQENFRFRHYGRFVERMIATALTVEDPEARHDLELLIANQMKKMMVEQIPDKAEDHRIFADLALLSHGEIRLSTERDRLNEYLPTPKTAKKKKKK